MQKSRRSTRSVIGKINNRYVLYPITKIPCPPVCGQGFFSGKQFQNVSLPVCFSKFFGRNALVIFFAEIAPKPQQKLYLLNL